MSDKTFAANIQFSQQSGIFILRLIMSYTQDESYYILDAKEDAHVYLGLKEGIQPDEMISDLESAQRGEIVFDADKYINKFPAKKHDHFLIPAGTCHCSGKNAMVLEISATPYIFTFKLWDWHVLMKFIIAFRLVKPCCIWAVWQVYVHSIISFSVFPPYII